MTQTLLDTLPQVGMCRSDGSDTMHEGAQAVAPKLNTMRGRVLNLFLQNPGGLTDPELVETYGALYGACIYRSVGTRRHELVLARALRDSGRRKPNPVTRVSNIIWEIIPHASAQER